jgi:hypothetical protein
MSFNRNLSLVHRWLGVVLCLFFTAWFASGIVLIYVPFPALSDVDRRAASTDVDVRRIETTPEEAIKSLNSELLYDQIRLIARSYRPLYVLHPRGGEVAAIWADNGQDASVGNSDDASTIAVRFSGSSVAKVEGPLDLDQWTVHEGFDSLRPYYRVSLDDEAGTVLYVSQRSGEVVQQTKRAERIWNYFGAIVHWIYPTVLRQHWAAWDQVVWWLSLVGILATVFGIWLGVVRAARAVRSDAGKISPFRGWMRWHHILGLFGGVFVLTWIVSGWLSMDHGRLLSVPSPQQTEVDRFRGISLAEAAAYSDLEEIHDLPAFREMTVQAAGNVPFIVVRSAERSQIIFLDSPSKIGIPELPVATIILAITAAWPGEEIESIAKVAANDTYVQLRTSGLPPTAVRVKLGEEGSTWVHVDAATGEIISVMDKSRRLNRWIFNGLHSLDFPGLVERRPLWDIVIVALLLFGLAFSISGVYLGARRLRRSFR